MPRGRAAGYDDQRGTILARAAELFAARGYAATSMNEVAAACGLSKATLYHYHRDKHELLAGIAEGHVARLQALVVETERRIEPPEARLRALILQLVAAYAGAQPAQRVLTEDVRFLEAADRQRVLDKERDIVARFASAVAALRPDLAEAGLATPMTMLLFGMMNWLFTWMKPGGGLSHETIAPIVADLFLGGLPAVSPPSADATRQAVLPATGVRSPSRRTA